MKRLFGRYLTIFLSALVGVMPIAQAAQQTINRGTTAGDGTGETLFSAFGKVNSNFSELYASSASKIGDAPNDGKTYARKNAAWAIQSMPVMAETYGASPSASAASNVSAIQSALNAKGTVTLTTPGVYQVDATLQIPSDTHFHIGKGVFIVRAAGGASNLTITNSDWVNGNKNIRLTGEGTIYCNHDGYRDSYAANPNDFPFIQELYDANLPGIRATVNSTNPTGNGVTFDNVDGLHVSGLRIMQAAKYQLYGSKISNFIFENLYFYGDDLTNPANGSTLGHDAIHVQGNSQNGIIRNIRGVANDDFIALNVRDVAGMVTPRSIGFIKNILIENIYGKNIRRGGAGVHIYGGLDVGTASPANTNGYDTAPAISAITNNSGQATVTTVTPHGMEPGQYFYISGSTPSGYNTGTAARGQTPGVVETVIDANNFTYRVASATAAYSGGAVLVRYYKMSNITVRNVNQQTHVGGAVQIGSFGVGNFGLQDNIRLENITGYASSPNGVGVVAIDTTRIYGLIVDGVKTKNQTLHPAFNGDYAGSPVIAGKSLLKSFVAEVPYKPYTASGQCWIMPGYYESMTISDVEASVINAGGGWNYAITASTVAASASLTIERPTISDIQGGGATIFTNQTAEAGTVTIRGAKPVTSTTAIVSLGGSVTHAKLNVIDTHGGAFTSSQIALYGTGITLTLSGNVFTSGSAGVIYSSTSGNINLISAGNNSFGTANLFNSGSTGNYTMKGFDLAADVTNSRIVGSAGSVMYNTNAAAGTLGVAGQIIYSTTSGVGKWHLLADPTKVY